MKFTEWIEVLSKAPGTSPPLWDDANTTLENLVAKNWIEPCGYGYAVTKSGESLMRSWQKAKQK